MIALSTSVKNIRYLGIGLGILIAIAGTIGNFLAIAAYHHNTRIQTPFNLLVVNLAVVDFIASTTITPITIYGYYEMRWTFSSQSCVAFGYFYFATHYTSSVLLVIISFNRFCHVSHRHAAYTRIFSGKRRWTVGPLLWLFSPLFLLPLAFTGGFGWWNDGLLCTYTRNNPFNNIYSLSARVVFQLIPLIMIIVLYSLVFRAVRKSHAKVDNLIAERCESVMMTTDTMGTSAVQTPTRASVHSTYTLGPNSHLQQSLPREPSSQNVEFQIEPHQKEKQNHEKSFDQPKSFSEHLSDFPIVALQMNSVQVSFATLCRTNTSENVESSEKSCDMLKEDTEALTKKRSATCSNLYTPQLFLSPSLQSIIEARKRKPTSEQIKSIPVRRERQGTMTPQRPRLSVATLQMGNPQNKPSPFTRRGNMSLPNLRRARKSASSQGKTDTLQLPPKMKRRTSRRKSIQHAKAQKNLLYMCAIICSAFALCSLPSLILNFWGDYDSIAPEFHILTTILSWLTSLINPIVYAAMNMQFRKEYSRMLKQITEVCMKKRRRKPKGCSRLKHQRVPSIHISGCNEPDNHRAVSKI